MLSSFSTKISIYMTSKAHGVLLFYQVCVKRACSCGAFSRNATFIRITIGSATAAVFAYRARFWCLCAEAILNNVRLAEVA